MPKRVALFLALLTTIAHHNAVAAQTRDTLSQPDTAVVQLAPIEAVSIRRAVSPSLKSALPAHMTSIDGDALHYHGNALQAISARAGASVHDDLGSPLKQTIEMRGFAAGPVVGMPQGISVLVDGVPVNEPAAGEVNLDLLPTDFTKRVEVLRGTSALLGANSLGGAVNLITRLGGEPGGRVELEAGQHGMRGARVEAAGAVRDFSYFGGAVHEHDDGWRARMGSTRTVLHTSAEESHANRTLGVRLTAARSRAETAGSLPLSVYLVRPDSNLTAGDFELLRQVALTSFLASTRPSGTFKAQVFLRAHSAERFNANQAADPDVRSLTSSRTAGLEADWTTTRPVRGGELSARVGSGGFLNHSRVEIFAERLDPGMTTHVESPIARANTYAVAAAGFGRLDVSAGARADLVRIPFRNRLDASRDTINTYLNLTPRAAISFAPAKSVAMYASVSRGFRPPALIELACADPHEPCPLPFALGDDPPLDPVTATTAEAGARIAKAAIAATLGVYRTNVRNDIFLLPYGDDDDGETRGSTIDGYFANIPRTRREGIETSVDFDTRRVKGFLALNVSRATFQTDGLELFSARDEAGEENEIQRGDRLPLVPDYVLSGGADFTPTENMSFGVTVRRVGSRYLRGDEANNDAPLAPFTNVDVHATAMWRGLDIDLRIANLFDASYLAFGTFNINQGTGALERFVTPGAPRQLRFSIGKSWGSYR